MVPLMMLLGMFDKAPPQPRSDVVTPPARWITLAPNDVRVVSVVR